MIFHSLLNKGMKMDHKKTDIIYIYLNIMVMVLILINVITNK